MRPAPLVISHANCFDGHTAAWVFNHFYQAKKTAIDPEPEYYSAHYGEKPPNCAGRDVYVLDFSYPRDVMINDIILPSNKTHVYDHHRTAEAALDGILMEIYTTRGIKRQSDKIVFDMNRSGAGITYDELVIEAGQRAGFHKPKTGGRHLWIVDYVEDRDLWKFKYERTGDFTAYMGTRPMTFAEWDAMNASSIAEIADKGKVVQAYIDQYGKKALDQARIEKIAGYKVYTVNMPYMNCSEHLHTLLTTPNDMTVKPDFVASYFRTMKGEWQFSLRSEGDFDVSEVAKKFGGGGHAHAAGFKVDKLPWENQGEFLASDTISTDEIPSTVGVIPTIQTPDGDDSTAKLGEDSA